MHKRQQLRVTYAFNAALGVPLALLGAWVFVSGIRGTLTAHHTGSVVLEQPLSIAGPRLEKTLEAKLPPGTSRLAVDLICHYKAQGQFRADARVEAGPAPASLGTTWSERRRVHAPGIVRRVGIAQTSAPTARVRVEVTPPHGAEVEQINARLMANPADELEEAEVMDIPFGFLILGIGAGMLFAARKAKRTLDETSPGAGL